MYEIETNIITYFNSKPNPDSIVLSPRNVARNLNIQLKVARSIMKNSSRLHRVQGLTVGSGRHIDNIQLYKLA